MESEYEKERARCIGQFATKSWKEIDTINSWASGDSVMWGGCFVCTKLKLVESNKFGVLLACTNMGYLQLYNTNMLVFGVCSAGEQGENDVRNRFTPAECQAIAGKYVQLVKDRVLKEFPSCF